MFSTFNMGIGMILTVDPADAGGVMDTLTAAGEKPSVIGKISSEGRRLDHQRRRNIINRGFK